MKNNINLLNSLGQNEKEFFDNYDPRNFQRPSVTVDMLLFTIVEGAAESYRALPEKYISVLLVKRADHPHIGKWGLPGGFVRMGESLEETAVRVLEEEVNLRDIYLEQLYTFGEVNRDPRTRVISSSYMSLVDSKLIEVAPGKEQREAKWFKTRSRLLKSSREVTASGEIEEELIEISFVSQNETLNAQVMKRTEIINRHRKITFEALPSEDIAFDHAKIIQYGLERLRNKIEYTDIAFTLMPERFTLTELQQVYEAILDKPLLKANFRRKISDMVLETNEYTRDAGHRPSRLYSFNIGFRNKDGI
jgi:8-oxo-dGTP diphosphatase